MAFQGVTVLVTCIDTIRGKNMHQFCGMQGRGCSFVVVTPDITNYSRNVLGDNDGVELVVATRGRASLSLPWKTLRAIFRWRPRIVEVYPFSWPSLLSTVVAKLAGIPVLVIARGHEYIYIRGGLKFLDRLFFRLTYALADAVLYKETYMESMLDQMGKTHRWYLPNVIKLPANVHQHRPERCRILFLNTMRAVRHPERVIEAFLDLCAERNWRADADVRLDIVGFMGENAVPEVAEKERYLRQMIEGKDVPIGFHPWTNQPEEWLDQADIFVLPTDTESANFALLEAMGRAAVPVVQDAPGSRRIVTDGQEGYVVPLEDRTLWKQRLQTLIDDPSLRTRMGNAAREKIARHNSMESYLDTYEAIYRSLMGSGS